MLNYSSNIDKVIDRLNGKFTKIQKDKRILLEVAENVLTSNVERIHEEGYAANLTKIASGYSTKPTLAGGNVFGNINAYGGTSGTFRTKKGANVFFGSKSKRRAASWATIKTPFGNRPLMLIKGGYKAIRMADGDRVDIVNLKRTGALMNGFQIVSSGPNSVSLGFRNNKQADKADSLTKRYKKRIWGYGKREKTIVNKILLKFVKNNLK